MKHENVCNKLKRAAIKLNKLDSNQQSGMGGGRGNGLLFVLKGSALDGSRLRDVVVASLLLEELFEVVLAVEHAFQCCVVGRRNCAPTVRTSEARLVIHLFFYRDLFKRISSFAASVAFLLCTAEHGGSFARRSSKLRSNLLVNRFCRRRRRRRRRMRLKGGFVGGGSGSESIFEELLEMGLTVEHSIH
jgi:hypothetical protein